MREQLDRFAQAHVVGKHASETVAREELQPGDAARLILTQRALECCRRRGRCERIFVGERAHQIAQLRRRGPAYRRRAFELRDRREVRGREREASLARERCVEELDERRQERRDALGRQRNKRALAHAAVDGRAVAKLRQPVVRTNAKLAQRADDDRQ